MALNVKGKKEASEASLLCFKFNPEGQRLNLTRGRTQATDCNIVVPRFAAKQQSASAASSTLRRKESVLRGEVQRAGTHTVHREPNRLILIRYSQHP